MAEAEMCSTSAALRRLPCPYGNLIYSDGKFAILTRI